MTEASAGHGGEGSTLPRLRRDLRLHEAPRQADGAPAWTIEDPVRAQYIRIGWAEVEMLNRWTLGSVEAVAATVTRDTPLTLTADAVQAFAKTLRTLTLVEPMGPRDTDQLWRQAQSRRLGWARWLLRNYLFLRLPLVRPDRILSRTLPLARRLVHPVALAATVLAGLLGLVLAVHQWDTFRHTFLHFFTLEGAAVAGVTLALTKIAHELGHAYTCKAFGLRVPTMGVAFLVLWPVLYTDTTAAWTLARRHPRLLIGAAGMLTELAIAAWATLAWSFLPDGMPRSAAFLLATTTWIMTLAVNLSPLMRFDGYFLLSDLLDVPNLQPRAFALARWRLREALFGLGDTPPERFPPGRQRVLLAYAFATWIYRFFLFLGIALLVYHYAFKLLGIALFAVEIGTFILGPLYREVRIWWSRRTEYHMNRNTLVSGGVAVILLAAALIPWHGAVEAPALLRAASEAVLVTPTGGRVEAVHVRPGDPVQAGDVLIRLDSPDTRHARDQLDRDIAMLRAQARFQVRRDQDAAHQEIARQALEVAVRRRAALDRRLAALEVTAPFDGRVTDMAIPLAENDWRPEGDWLVTVTGSPGAGVEAYVGERDRDRLAQGARAWFLPEDVARPRLRLTVQEVSETAVQTLAAAPELASVHHGPIASHARENGPPLPEEALYRVLLRPTDPGTTPGQISRGTVHIEAAPESFVARAWPALVAVLIRETAF